MKKKNLVLTVKSGLLLLLMSISFLSCDKSKENGDEPIAESQEIVGKWQKYRVVGKDGNWVEGDLDEFWIYNSDGTFQNEDGGEITATGTYQTEGSLLTIYSHSLSEPNKKENLSGNYSINNGEMLYEFVDLDYGDKSKILFKKM